jgi:hypothetical protein
LADLGAAFSTLLTLEAGVSENWIRIIPENPHVVPEEGRQKRALARVREIAPHAAGVFLDMHDRVEFFDCGQNFERVVCPVCDAVLPIKWWQERMDDDYAPGFKLLKYPTPCCRTGHTLHELRYDWPQGFGRFALNVRDPGIRSLTAEQIQEVSEILGTPLRIIYQRR